MGFELKRITSSSWPPVSDYLFQDSSRTSLTQRVCVVLVLWCMMGDTVDGVWGVQNIKSCLTFYFCPFLIPLILFLLSSRPSFFDCAISRPTWVDFSPTPYLHPSSFLAPLVNEGRAEIVVSGIHFLGRPTGQRSCLLCCEWTFPLTLRDKGRRFTHPSYIECLVKLEGWPSYIPGDLVFYNINVTNNWSQVNPRSKS